jgi:hypothetical protein
MRAFALLSCLLAAPLCAAQEAVLGDLPSSSGIFYD